MTRVELRNASRAFGLGAETVWAVRDVTWQFDAGTMIGLHGVSGSGKSTLLSLIAGLDAATSGEVRVDSQDLAHLDENARADLRLARVGVVFQDHNLIEEFTALENVMLPLEVRQNDRPRARREALEALRRVGLDGLEDRHPSQMSGGQRQRVGIARAVVGQRDILLADEPTGALDSATSRDVFAILRRLADAGTLVIVATHDAVISRYADEMLEIVDGSVRAVDPADARTVAAP